MSDSAILWAVAHQALPSSTIFQSLLKFMSIELVILSNQFILSCPLYCLQYFPASVSFPMNWPFPTVDQNIGVSASASVFLKNFQSRFPLGINGLISLQSKGLSRVFSSTTIRKHPFFGSQSSLWPNSHICTGLLEKR